MYISCKLCDGHELRFLLFADQRRPAPTIKYLNIFFSLVVHINAHYIIVIWPSARALVCVCVCMFMGFVSVFR